MIADARVHVVPEDAGTEYLDRYASTVFPELPSRRSARKAAKRGDLRVGGAIVGWDRVIGPGDRLELRLGEGAARPAFHLPLDVVFEDEWMAVVCKPPGFVTSGNRHRTVEHALPVNLARSGAPDALPRPLPVHRLDYGTGGLLLVAKCRRAQIALGRDLEDHRVRKRYRALAIGRLEGEGTIEAPIDGRPAVSDYRAVTHTHALKSDWVTTVDLWPRTGRTHQLRRHLASLGHPILGDTAYGLPTLTLKGKGLFLWAVELLFAHPITGDSVWTAVREPAKFESFRLREERRWQRYQGDRPDDQATENTE